jgi:ubiquitin-protein ligase E3 D
MNARPGPAVVVEVLDGIGCTFVYLLGKREARGGASPQDGIPREIEEGLGQTRYTLYRERTSVIKIEKADWETGETEGPVEMEARLRTIGCRCGKKAVENTSVLRLPSENWEELVDMWSCHNREFEEMLGREISPRKNGVLYADLFIILERGRLACECMQGCSLADGGRGATEKLFFNEFSHALCENDLILLFLLEQFRTESKISLSDGMHVYAVRSLGQSRICAEFPPAGLRRGLKVGFVKKRGTSNEAVEGERINRYFAQAIIEKIEANRTGILLGSYELSFVGA